MGPLRSRLNIPIVSKAAPAFAPIVEPSTADWSSGAFSRYLAEDKDAWRPYDACSLIEGDADGFLNDGLRPWLLEEACKKSGIGLTLRMQGGYDHSYHFISTFMEDHLHWHAARLNA